MNSNSLHACTICGAPTQHNFQLRGRLYCPLHFAGVAEDYRPLWRATSITTLVVVLLVAALAGADFLTQGQTVSPLTLRILALATAALPGLFWLTTLLIQSVGSRDKFPRQLLVVMTMSALLAAAVVDPLLGDVLSHNLWLSRLTGTNRLFMSILIGGSFHSAVLYFVIRFIVWGTPNFTKQIDGLLYTLAAGWGYATMLNLLFVIDQPSISLLHGNLRIISQMAAYMSMSTLLGVLLGFIRFSDFNPLVMPATFLASAVTYGFASYASVSLNSNRLGITSDAYTPWPGSVFVLLLFISLSLGAYGLLRRSNNSLKVRQSFVIQEREQPTT